MTDVTLPTGQVSRSRNAADHLYRSRAAASRRLLRARWYPVRTMPLSFAVEEATGPVRVPANPESDRRRVWTNPLDQGAHLMSMSTYKSLGGPPGGLLLVNDAELAQRIEAIAYPGLTANFDAGKTAALAQTMLDWTVAGPAYAAAMVDTARALAERLLAAWRTQFDQVYFTTDNPTVPPRSNAA